MAKKILTFTQFVADLQKGSTEEDIKNGYAHHFGIRYDTAGKHDLYTPHVLFEFKFDKNFTNLRTRATVVAQILYYIRRLKFGYTEKPIPPILCLADKNEAILTETTKWRAFYSETNGNYDWDVAPSNPDPKLINDIFESEELRNLHIYNILESQDYSLFAERLHAILGGQEAFQNMEKKAITEENFEEVYEYWNKIFGESVRNGLKTSRYFVCDIQQGRTIYIASESKVFFDFGGGDGRTKKILAKDYEFFWKTFEKVTNPAIIRGILAKIDRLTDEAMRRFHGEFFTPVSFAKKGLEYVEKTVGHQWWKRGNVRLWDMAAGTGNLEYHLPTEALQYTYLSTLYKEDAEHLGKLFPTSTIFQYDYLNDDIGNIFAQDMLPFGITWKLPEQLRRDLANPEIEWIILINPPFATSQTAGTTSGKSSKSDVSDTHIRKLMHGQNLGEVSRELFAQFLFRIKYEFAHKKAHLGLFSKLKYINANNDQNFRDKVFQFGFERGFMFSSVNFQGTSRASQFPVGFLIWNLQIARHIESQHIVLDLFNTDVEKIDRKTIASEHRDRFLSKWVDRPNATIIFPPFGGSITVKGENTDVRDRIAPNFLASLMCAGNDVQHQNNTALLSGPYVSAGAFSIIPENFEKAMIVHTVRRLPKATWINDRDQFLQPDKELSKDFTTDCIVWSLLSNSNETVSMRNVQYKKQTYQIENHFYPFLKQEVSGWAITDSDISTTLMHGDDRFVAKWLHGRTLSTEAKAVIQAAREAYKFFYAHLNKLNTTKFRIETYDAGWWQIRSSLSDQDLGTSELAAVKSAHDALKQKLLPQIVEFGFLR